jgi:hypothetical protein
VFRSLRGAADHCRDMSNTILAAQLRARATHLRSVSRRIGDSRALTVHAMSGPETWVGPTPQSVHDSLLTIRRRLAEQHDALLRSAAAMDRRARELELGTTSRTTVT